MLTVGWFGFVRLPGGFLPNDDKGSVLVQVQLPDSASLERTEDVLDRVTAPGVRDVVSVGGLSLLTGMNASNTAAVIVVLDDWSARASPGLHVRAIAARVSGQLLSVAGSDRPRLHAAADYGLGQRRGLRVRAPRSWGAGSAAISRRSRTTWRRPPTGTPS